MNLPQIDATPSIQALPPAPAVPSRSEEEVRLAVQEVADRVTKHEPVFAPATPQDEAVFRNLPVSALGEHRSVVSLLEQAETALDDGKIRHAYFLASAADLKNLSVGAAIVTAEETLEKNPDAPSRPGTVGSEMDTMRKAAEAGTIADVSAADVAKIALGAHTDAEMATQWATLTGQSEPVDPDIVAAWLADQGQIINLDDDERQEDRGSAAPEALAFGAPDAAYELQPTSQLRDALDGGQGQGITPTLAPAF